MEVGTHRISLHASEWAEYAFAMLPSGMIFAIQSGTRVHPALWIGMLQATQSLRYGDGGTVFANAAAARTEAPVA